MKKKLAEEVIKPDEVKKPSKASNAYLEAYKLQNPEKYEAKMKSGEFAKKGLLVLAVAVLIGAGAIFGVARASDGGFWDRVAQITGEILGNNLSDKVDVPANFDFLGATPSNSSVTSLEDNNSDQVYHIYKDFTDATTTIVSIPDPFLAYSNTSTGVVVLKTDSTGNYWIGATSTLELVKLNITGPATTSFSVVCGSSDGAANAPVYHILGSGTVATSTLAVIENNVTTLGGAVVSGSSTAKILLTPTHPYLTCLVTVVNAGSEAAFTQTGNTFAGRVHIRVSRPRI